MENIGMIVVRKRLDLLEIRPQRLWMLAVPYVAID
jgi:hypothetical protein